MLACCKTRHTNEVNNGKGGLQPADVGVGSVGYSNPAPGSEAALSYSAEQRLAEFLESEGSGTRWMVLLPSG